MKRNLQILFIYLFTIPPFVQGQVSDEPVFIVAEKMPEYPGGMDSLIKDISEKVIYPQVCIDSNIQGMVHLRFVVNQDGSISDVIAGNGKHDSLKSAAIRAVNGIRKFSPAVENGKPVRVYYNVPVAFKIKTEEVSNVQNSKRPGNETPGFPGGNAALIEFIQKHIRYPSEEKTKSIQGKVITYFTVMEDGSVEDIRVLRGLTPACNDEALRVVSKLPKFKPAQKNYEAARSSFTLPVLFTLKQDMQYAAEKDSLVNEIDLLNRLDIAAGEQEVGPSDEHPQFPGGLPVLRKWIFDWLDTRRLIGNASRLVVLRLDISEEGRVKNAAVVRGSNPRFDQQIRTLGEQLPDFKPATINGTPVKSTLEISFRF